MQWRGVDLNLLVVFDAVMQERSVTRAGRKIGLSQPAMSHALSRLRHMLRDELFVRTPDGMVPTPRAEQLAEPLRRALKDMQLALEPDEFEPSRARRRFLLTVNNYAAIVLAPALVAAAASAAPSVQLDFRPSGTLDVQQRLDRDEFDLAIGSIDQAGERFTVAPLLDDLFVVAMRRDHPAAREVLTAEAFAALPHLEVSSGGEDTSFVDGWLAKQGLGRQVAHRAPHLSIVAMLLHSDMIVILSRRIAERLLRSEPLWIAELPCPSPRLATAMLWHRRLDRQPAHRWLRQLVQSTCQELQRPAAPRQSTAAMSR